MSGRIETVTRGRGISITVDGVPIPAFEGETIATALLATGRAAFRHDLTGDARGLFCNMGTCSECFVRVSGIGPTPRRLRACLTPVADGLTIETGDAVDD